MTARNSRALALALLVLSLACSPLAPRAAAAPLAPGESADACGGEPGRPHPNAGCQLPLTRGVNLAVWLQYGIPSTYTTAKDLAQIRALGFTFVRLPVNPELLFHGNAGSRTMDQDKAALVKSAVQLAIDADLAVIIDMHPSASYAKKVLTDAASTSEYSRFLTNFARAISDLPGDRIALGLLNEPNDPDGDADTPFDYNPLQRRFWAAARAGAGDLTLIATGDDWSSIEGLQRVTLLPDPNVIYEFHFYTPFLFTHQGAAWTWHVVKPIHGLPYPSDDANVAAVRDSILDPIQESGLQREVAQHLTGYGTGGWDRAKLSEKLSGAATWARENDARVFLGEFGVFEEKAPQADRVQWTRDVRELAESHGIAWAYWNWDSDFGIVERDTGEVHDGLRAALVE